MNWEAPSVLRRGSSLITYQVAVDNSSSHSDVVRYYITRCRGTGVPIGVNLR
jgi:hypothetical protein